MSEPQLRSLPLMGRRSVLRLLGLAALGLVAGCRSGKQRTAPTSPDPSTTPPSGSPRPGATSPPRTSAAPSPEPTASATSPDQVVAQRVAVAEQALLGAYDAVTAAHPELTGRLAAFRADHVAHLQGLVSGATPPSATLSTPALSTPALPTPALSTPALSTPALSTPALSSPPASTAILHELADLERSAAAARLDDVATTSGSLARLVASIGGCEAAHAALLSAAT